MQQKLFPLLLFITIVFSISSCCKKDCCKKECKEPEPTATFNKQAMLENIGNNIIISNYQSLNTEATEMDAAVAAFNSAPSVASLIALRNSFKEAYTAWQHCSVFEFGPAAQHVLRSSLNTFPTDTAQISANINTGSYDFASASNIDAQGFPAIDYLLCFSGNDSCIVARFSSSQGKRDYLKALSARIKTLTETVTNGWVSSGGNYISTFVNAQGSDIGSSLGLMVNQLNYDWEIIKTNKIGIPAGKKTLGVAMPEKVEAYYSGISISLTIENFKTIQNLYLGKSKSGTDGIGLEEYLVFLNSQYNGGLLSDAIKAQFINTQSALTAVPDPLSQTITSNFAVVDKAYTEIQKQLVLFKTDMPSAMGILITYQDNDGD